MKSIKKLFYVIIIDLVVLCFACERNHPPVIVEITQEPASTSAGTVFILEVSANDEDGDELFYYWSATEGEFLSPKNMAQVKWKSPSTGNGNMFSISVAVSDGEFEAVKEHIIELTEPIFGSITGYVYYTNSKIPVPGVLVKVADNESVTDIYGQYSIINLVSGQDTLKAVKEDFSPKELLISIPPNAVLNYDLEMTSVAHSTKTFGVVSDQDGQPLANVQVLILNPNGSESNLAAYTGADGIYRILYVPHGGRTIVVRKSASDDYKYSEIKQEIECTDIEQRFDFVIEKIPLRGQFTDARDNQEYSFKTIGNQTWTTVNLSYLPHVNDPTEQSDNKPYFYVFGYHGTDTTEAKVLEKYRNYGVLYNWEAAIKACPQGWHLPSKLEWETLITLIEPRAAYKMKTISGWIDQGNGDNSSGFSALPGGYLTKDGKFSQLGGSAFFYSSSELSTTIAWGRTLYSGSETAWPYSDSKQTAYSVRCIRDL